MLDENPYSKYEPFFGSWHIKGLIGKGAISKVYEIEKVEQGVTYGAALKVISVPADDEEIMSVLSSGVAREDLGEYYRELKQKVVTRFLFMAMLKGSSHIVRYEDYLLYDKEDGIGWDLLIRTELLTPLVGYAVDHPLTEADVLKLGMDLCKALDYCSLHGVIHRDIKPENILIAPNGDYKLGDFDIAKAIKGTKMNLSRKGTYLYMAPEVFRGASYGYSADIYSLGLVMYKYLNYGRNAFMPAYPAKIHFDDSEQAFVERMSGKELPPSATGSDALKAIVLKACAHDPAKRYATARDMLNDLKKVK